MKNNYTLVGTIPDEIFNKEIKTVVKVQLPLGGDISVACIYDQSRKWDLFIPVEDLKIAGLDMGKEVKKYFTFWFDKNHTANFGNEIREEQFW